MHLDHQLVINTDMIHSEYELVQKGNPNSAIPAYTNTSPKVVPAPKFKIRPKNTSGQSILLTAFVKGTNTPLAFTGA